MQDLQSIFNRIQEAKKKQKDLKAMYSDALSTAQEYQEIKEKMKTMRDRKKQIEVTIKEQFVSEMTKLEDLKIDIESDMELLSDMAMTQLMKGETLEIKDEYDNGYEPTFKVKFKKVN